jgi:hypothetical protein
VTRQPGARAEAAALILDFLACVGDAKIERICRFMATQPLSYAPGATRTTVARLAQQGRIVRVSLGRYRRRED